MNIVNPLEIYFEGDDYRAAIALLDFINSNIPKNFDKKMMRAELQIDHPINLLTQLFIIKEMQQKWFVSFNCDDGITIIIAIPLITQDEKRYLK